MNELPENAEITKKESSLPAEVQKTKEALSKTAAFYRKVAAILQEASDAIGALESRDERAN